MNHIVAISPHLDDAAFSIGGMLAAHARAGGRVTIVTCFTGNVTAPTGFALACQLDKGLPPDIDYMALRRAEDRAACNVIGATAIHLPFLEAPHRGYASAPDLFGARHVGDDMTSLLTRALAVQVAALQPDMLLGPLAIGNHVDHWMVRDALAAIEPAALLWEDWPYLARSLAAPREPLRRQHGLSQADRTDRTSMCAAFTSQIGFQFGSVAAMAAAIERIDVERLYASS